MDVTARTNELVQMNIGNLVVSLAQANATIEAQAAQIAALTTERDALKEKRGHLRAAK